MISNFTKRYCSVFLMILIVCSVFSADVFYAADSKVAFISNRDTHMTNIGIMNNADEASIQFKAEGTFNYIEIFMLESIKKTVLTAELYKWDTNYNKTMNDKPVYTFSHSGTKKDTLLKLECSEDMPAGEYLLHLKSKEKKLPSFRRALIQSDIAFIYLDGYKINGTPDAYINYTDGSTTLGKVSDSDFEFFTAGEEPPLDQSVIDMDVRPDTWVATDGLGRTLDTYEDIGDIRENRTVGIFYWTWHDELSKSTPVIRNNTQILANAPEEAIYDFNHPIWEGYTCYHFWDEPLFGYYSSADKYVLRKHAEMLADAGVDVVVFDNTNGSYTWENSFMTLLEVFDQAQKEGVNVPKITFMSNFGAVASTREFVREVYDILYRKELYKDLWFYWEGKPLMWAYPEVFENGDLKDDEIKQFFTFRRPAGGNSDYEWGWITNYPPVPHYDENGNLEQMAVGVSQRIGAMNSTESVGRGYSNTGKYDNIWNPGWLYGIHFQEMFDYAIDADPEFLFITGWNEWVAMRFEEWGGTKNAFPDQYDYLRSRDAEPSSGVLRDNYYYVLINNIRRYKGLSKPELQTAEKTIDVNGNASQWDSGVAVFNHYIGSTRERDCVGYGRIRYTSDTMRNDIVTSKIAYDKDNIYFYVDTVEDITSSSDNAWMRLLIDTDPTGKSPNWEGFEFIVNRINPDSSTCTLERSLGVGDSLTDWKWEKAADVPYSVKGNVLQIAIPRKILGLTDDKFTFNFKWSDNMQTEGDILDFYKSGDVAPGERFMFRFANYDIVYTAVKKGVNIIWIVGVCTGILIAAAASFIIIKKLKNKKN